MPDKKIMAGGAVLAAAGFWFFVKPNYLDPAPPPIPPTAEEIAAAPRPTIYLGRIPGEKEKPPTDVGVVYNLKAPAASPAYAKVVLALEFEDPHHAYVGLKPTAVEAKNALFAEELRPEMYRVSDAITRVMGSRGPDEVSTSEGREQLKSDLRTAINDVLHEEKVAAVYFVTFVTQ